MNLTTLAWVTLMTAIAVLGDYFLKRASMAPSSTLAWTMYVGALCYASTAPIWVALMKTNSLGALGVWFSAMSIILMALLGYFVFNESLGGRKMLGIALAVVAVLVIAEE